MKRSISLLAGIFTLVILFVLAFVIHDFGIAKQRTAWPPNRYSRYLESENGYYKINTEKLLSSLHEGKTDGFTPMLEDPDLIEALTNVTIAWSQSDFMKIGSAIGLLAWDDPMGLENWQIYSMHFEQSCHYSLDGFSFGSIVYFKETESNGKKMYTTRIVEIEPYYSWVRWGGGVEYPKPILSKWKSVNISDSSITAETRLS